MVVDAVKTTKIRRGLRGAKLRLSHALVRLLSAYSRPTSVYLSDNIHQN